MKHRIQHSALVKSYRLLLIMAAVLLLTVQPAPAVGAPPATVDVAATILPAASAGSESAPPEGMPADAWTRIVATIWEDTRQQQMAQIADAPLTSFENTVALAEISPDKKFKASDAAQLDQFGIDVAISGDTIVVGANWDDDSGSNSGSAYIFNRSQGGINNWGQVKKLTASDGAANDWFGESVAISGDTVVVGAFGNDGAGSTAGAAYVFERNQGGTDNWGEVKKLTASDAAGSEAFGSDVAISGDTIVVGARADDNLNPFSDDGSAYVFERNQGGANNWGEVKKLTASDAATDDDFGEAVTISGDTIVIGAHLADAGGADSGAAYVFERNLGGTDNWGQVKKLIASDAAAGDRFGDAIAISGNTLVVGSLADDDMCPAWIPDCNTGSAYVFERNQGGTNNWGQVRKLTVSDARFRVLGASVGIDGDTIIIGTSLKKALVFVRNAGGTDNWGEAARLGVNGWGDGFARSVAISGNTAVVGAHGDDESIINSGAAFVFSLPDLSNVNIPVPPVPETRIPGTDGFGWAVAISGDTLVVGDSFKNSLTGAVYIFNRNNGGPNNWGWVTQLAASDSASGDRFGFSVAIDGDTVVIGAVNDDDAGNNSGSAYVFERNQGGADNWGQVKKVTAGADASAGDFFGSSVSISGETVVVGAPNSPLSSATGAAYVFQRNQNGSNNWGRTKRLTAGADSSSDDGFGRGAGISGSTVVATAFVNSTDVVYVFDRNQGGANNWGQSKKLTAQGTAVAVSGDTVVAGHGFIFERNHGGPDNWGQVANLNASGSSVAISGDLAVFVSGTASVFERDRGGPDNWGQVVELDPNPNETFISFGRSGAIAGTTVVVGADGAQSAYVYEFPDLTASKLNDVSSNVPLGSSWTWTVTIANTGTGAATFNNGQTIISDTLPVGNISYGGVSVTNVTGIINTGNISCAINAGSDLICTASGDKVTIGANTGSFGVQFTATPSTLGLFANPRGGGSCRVNPDNLVVESAVSNDACSDTVTVTAPDLTATKTNGVSDNTVFGSSWTWTITVANEDGVDATFTNGQTIISDTLPASNISYGAVSVSNVTNVTNSGSIGCAVDGSSNLACTASNGAVTIGANTGRFDVEFTATPTGAGTFANPRDGGSCTADPSNVIAESNEGNNTCGNTVIVDKAPATATVGNQAVTFSDLDQSVSLTATVTSSAGTVNQGTVTFQVKDGTTNVGTPVTSATLTAGTVSVTYVLPAGTTPNAYTIEASYSGGSNFAASSGTGTLTVSKAPTTVTVDDQTATFSDADQGLTLTATVAGSTVNQGTITFQIKAGTTNIGTAVTSATLTDGTASVTYTLPGGTGAGDYTIEAFYSGGSNFAASSGTGALTVNKAPTTVTVDDQSTNFSVALQNVTLSATVAGSVVNQGTVTFQVKAGTTNVGSAVTSAPLTAGTASVTYALPAGTAASDYTIEASYSGGSNFEASSGTGALHVNQPPTISAVADQAIPEDGTTGSLAFTVGDLETTPAGLTVSASSSNTTLVPTANVVLGGAGANRTVAVTPAANQSGSVIITLTVTDGDGASTSISFTVEVTPVNDPPVADDQSVSTDEETARAIILTGSDVEGSALTFSIVLGPANGTLSGTPPNVTYTPNANFNGADSFTFKANDGALDSNVATVSITVNPINDPPAADAQPVSTDEDTAVAITLTGSDPEGSALTFSVVSSPVHGTLSGTPPDVTYAPAANFNGADNFTFKVNDGELDSNSATVSIAVNPVNDAPNAVQDAATTDEDTAVTINVLANDTDLEGDPLTVTNVTPGGNGSVAINGDNTVTYTPNANFNGTDSFTYTVDDGNAGTDTATVNVIVASANDTVNAVDDSATTDEDTAVNIDVLANDTDADNDPLSVVGVTQGANGTVAINLDNTVTYTPSANFNGTDTFTYTVTDGNGGANTAQVAVTVNAVNDAPDAVGDADTTPENTPIFIEVTTNDTDVDGDAVSVSGITQGANGSAVIYNNSTVKYAPNANYSGADSFSYTIDDGNGGTDTASVAVTVDPVNDPPNAVDDAAGLDEDNTTTINVLANDSDPEGDSLSVASVTQGSHGSVGINVDGTLTYTPTLNFNGPDTFNYTIGDGNGLSDTAEVIVTINPVNDVPDAVQDSATPAADTPATIGVLANDTDVDGDTLTVIGVTQGANGSVVINADNTVTYTPAPASSGTDSFTYTVSDGNGGSDTTTVTVVVAPDPNAINQQNDSGTTNEGDPVTINVLGNDSPAAGLVLALPGDSQPADASQTPAQANPLSVASVTKGSQGSVIVNLDGTVTYTPAPSFSGQDTFTYVVSDGQTGADTATVTVDITSVNDAPDAVNDIATTNEDTATTFDPTTNDTDEENNVLTVTGVSQGNHGSVSLNLNNSVTYTPNADFSGADAFSYTIDDGQGGSDTAIVNVTVNPVNDMPNAVDDPGTTNEGAATTISALVNDTDVDGDTLSVTGATQGVNGSVAINPDGSLTYTPNADFNGTDSFGYTADDGQGLSDTATVTVTVNAVNDAPSFATGSDQTVGNAAGAQTVPGWATAISAGPSDEAGQVLTFHATNDNNALFAAQPAIDAATGNLTYTPASGANGSGTVTAILRDDGGTANGGVDASPAQTFTITITGQACLDFNNSGLVDVQDAVLIAGAWRAKDAPTLALYDFNSNGVVDIGDIMTVAAQFGQSCP